MNDQSKTVEHLTVKTGEKMKEKSQIITEKNGARNRKTGDKTNNVTKMVQEGGKLREKLTGHRANTDLKIERKRK